MLYLNQLIHQGENHFALINPDGLYLNINTANTGNTVRFGRLFDLEDIKALYEELLNNYEGNYRWLNLR